MAGVAAASALALVAACSGGSGAPASQETGAGGTTPATEDALTIGFVPGIASDPFFLAMQLGAEDKAEEMGIELIWQGAPDEYSPQSQIPFVDTMLTQQVDGLIIVPTDPDALQPSVAEAVSMDIPVITVDTTVTDQSDLVSHITGDNVDGGRLAGHTLAEQIGGEGKVFLMSGSPTATTNTLREQGFMEALEEYPDIELVGKEYANSQPAAATSAVSTVLLKHPDLAGIFAVDGTSGTGTVAALRNNDKVGEVALIGYDAYENQVADLQDGAFTALVAQKPGDMAGLALEYIVAAINGDDSAVESDVVMENVVITQENFDETKQYQYPS
ncbi:ABC transporter substrate-binding protein [Georgenia subflava]|uniref:ABC transporter substrate-binding protein n=1 Tax=Georgenia subflava TaxID=1622177 RepID=UPI001D0061BB|nr:ABC transporter substrate-binding protein [Georgenia subflava]